MKWLAEHKIGVWAFAVAIAHVPGIMSALYLGRWAIIALGIPLLAPMSLDRLAMPVRVALIAGMMLAAALTFQSPDRLQGALELFFIACVIGVAVVASHAEEIDEAMTGVSLGIGVASVIGIAQLAGYSPVEQVTGHPAGLFYNSEVFAELAAPVFVWAVVSRRWPQALACLLPLVVDGSRVSMLAVALGTAFAMKSRLGWKGVLAALGLLICAAVLFLRMSEFRVGSLALRATFWLEAAYAITPFGHGLGWFIARHTEDYAHSDVIQAMAELGIGALVFAVVPIYCLFKGRGDYAERSAFVAICFESLVSFPLHIPPCAFVAALLAGRLARRRGAVSGAGYERGDHIGAGRSSLFAGRSCLAGQPGRPAVSLRSPHSVMAIHHSGAR